MERKSKSAKTKILIIIVVAIISFIPFFSKMIGIDFSWEDASVKLNVVGDSSLSDYPVSVHFIDVGQGNCTLVTSDFGNIMIDCGEVDQRDTLIDYLDNFRIKKIDYLIATHPHSDHIGGMSSVINHCEIGKFFMPEVDESDIPTTDCYESLLLALDKQNVNSSYMKSGDCFSLGEIKCSALAPVTTIKGNLNSMSIVLKIEYKNTSFLITGDAESDEEKTILDSGANLKSNVMLIGHHGSKSSTSNDFLKAVSPDVAVISCGHDNKYGHPHKQTLTKLNKLSIPYYRTDTDSTVIFSSDGNRIIDHQTGDKDE